MRRGLKSRKVIQPDRTTFDQVRIGQAFYLTPENTVRLMWLKVCAWGAQYHNWDNDSSQPDQYFPPDYPVFTRP